MNTRKKLAGAAVLLAPVLAICIAWSYHGHQTKVAAVQEWNCPNNGYCECDGTCSTNHSQRCGAAPGCDQLRKQPKPKHGKTDVLLLLGLISCAVPFLFGLTITQVRPPNEQLPVESYAANVAILTSDASPSVVPLPAALIALFTAMGLSAQQLKYTLTPLAVGSATAGLSVVYDGTANLDITHATGANTATTLYVEVAAPTTNNMP